MIIDTFEYNRPVVGDSIRYSLTKNTNDDMYDTELNGTVYEMETKWVYISFGGLLCTFLKEDVQEFKVYDNVYLKYSILRN
jgi:hypothetical protein